MVVNSKIRDSDWLTFTLTIVNFNYVFIQPAPYDLRRQRDGYEYNEIYNIIEKK